MSDPLPPNLDDNAPWKVRYRTKGTIWTAIATGRMERGLACGNQSGVYQLYAWDVPSGLLRQHTFKPTGKSYGDISPDGSYIYYLDDNGGNEIGHYVRVPFEGGDARDITPDLPPYSSFGIQFSRSGNITGFVAADAEGFHVFAVDVSPGGDLGAPRAIYHNPKLMFGPALSADGTTGVMTTTEHTATADFSLHAFDMQSGESLIELWDGDGNSLEMFRFSPIAGDYRLLGSANRTGSRRPLLWDARTGERSDIAPGDLQGDLLPIDWSPDGKRLLLCQVNQAVQKLYLYDLQSGSLSPINHPEGSYGYFGEGGIYFGPGSEIFAQWQDSANPSRPIAIDPDTRSVRTLIEPNPVPSGHSWRSITFQSTDRTPIQGWLSLPDGDGPFPTILHTHGGPVTVTTQAFSPAAQSWLDHGYAFLTINYRGSTTFGTDFQKQIFGNPGRWEIEDMRAAHNWLVENNIAEPGKILVTGGSYGGYLTLLALGRLPELFAAGMGMVAIADWSLMYADEAETLRGFQRALFGGTPDELPKQYATSSPISYTKDVRAPLLVIQGRNDTRCPHHQMEVYEARMRELGKPIVVQWFDAGHGSLEIEQQISQQEEMLKFAYRVLQRD